MKENRHYKQVPPRTFPYEFRGPKNSHLSLFDLTNLITKRKRVTFLKGRHPNKTYIKDLFSML